VNLPVLTKVLEPGDYCLELFYADLYPNHAKLFFDVETADVAVSADSEPGSWAPISPKRCRMVIS
jgi:hypothetical protein